MPTTRATVDSLLRQVEFLPAEKQREFYRRLAAKPTIRASRRDQSISPSEAALVRTTQSRLSKRDDRRIRQLTAKSERGELSREELREYRALARKAEQLSVVRVRALAELVRIRGKSAREVMDEIGWESPNDDD